MCFFDSYQCKILIYIDKLNTYPTIEDAYLSLLHTKYTLYLENNSLREKKRKKKAKKKKIVFASNQ